MQILLSKGLSTAGSAFGFGLVPHLELAQLSLEWVAVVAAEEVQAAAEVQHMRQLYRR